ncbi:hypothetical protein SFR_3269 [Streptomyces sp. FR-008]|nr:hypothetical protein SFR_3269 [Streptomyces sp. FR-008]
MGRLLLSTLDRRLVAVRAEVQRLLARVRLDGLDDRDADQFLPVPEGDHVSLCQARVIGNRAVPAVVLRGIVVVPVVPGVLPSVPQSQHQPRSGHSTPNLS